MTVAWMGEICNKQSILVGKYWHRRGWC